MRAILLAAGRGTRLKSDRPMPKCLLAFGGRTLLERHLAILDEVGVDEVVLAVGFEPDPIFAELARLGRSDDVEIVVNPRFELGSVLTVHMTADALTRGGDVLLMDADVLYDARILHALTKDDHADRLLIDRGFEPGDEPVKVCLNHGVPVEFRKRVADGLAYDTIGESVGFFRFREATARRFAALVASYVEGGRAEQPHEEAIRDLLLAAGDTTTPGFDVADVTGLPWIEIDFPADVVRAETQVLPRIEQSMSRQP
jgi:choline kinase